MKLYHVEDCKESKSCLCLHKIINIFFCFILTLSYNIHQIMKFIGNSMTIFKVSSLFFTLLLFQGCAYRIITTHEECVSRELIFEFKDKKKLCFIDDSQAKRKYSSMGIKDGEYYLGIDSSCDLYSSDTIKSIPVKSIPFHLTGIYKTNTPMGILAMAIDKTSSIQADFNGIKVWMSLYDFEEYYHKDYVQENIKKLKEKSALTGSWISKFECPNKKSRIAYWTIKE